MHNRTHRLAHLKILIKTLAASSAIIRIEERGKLRHARYIRVSDAELLTNTPSDKELAARGAFNELHLMRVNTVRKECRAAQIAYSYLRGRPLDQIEISAKNCPNWTRVVTLALEYHTKELDFTRGIIRDGLGAWIRKSNLAADLRPTFAR